MAMAQWGDNFYDATDKKWTNQMVSKSNEKLERGFCAFILKPIETLFTAVMADNKPIYGECFRRVAALDDPSIICVF